MVDKIILKNLKISLEVWRILGKRRSGKEAEYYKGGIKALTLAIKATEAIMKKAGKKID